MQSTEFLAQIPLFQDLSAAELLALGASLRRRSYAKGQVVFYDEDPGAACYIIEEGKVRISVSSADGKQVTFSMLGPGDLFGELALLDGETRSADAVALEPCRLLELRRDLFLTFLRGHQEATLKLLTALASRLRHTSELLEDAVFLHVSARLAKVLLELSESHGVPADAGILINLPLNQSEIAALVGATRESINKWLGYYQQRGFVQADGGKLVVCRPEELRRQVY